MQRLQGAFPTYGTIGIVPICLFDLVVADGWSLGDTSFVIPGGSPTLAKPWTIYGLAISGKGALAGQTNQQHGKLGKLSASLLVGGTYSTQHVQSFSQPPNEALPNLVTLWDGSSDSAFPSYRTTMTAAPAGGHFSELFMLPVPQPMSAGERLALGLWLTPMLGVAGMQIVIYNCLYTVLYDY